MSKKLTKSFIEPFNTKSYCFISFSIFALMFLEVLLAVNQLKNFYNANGYIIIIIMLGIIGCVMGLKLSYKLVFIDDEDIITESIKMKDNKKENQQLD